MATEREKAEQAPKTDRTYERADPQHESTTGSLNKTPTAPQPSPAEEPKKKDPHVTGQRNDSGSLDDGGTPGKRSLGTADHTMLDEEPLGADQRPVQANENDTARHPRTEGKGGMHK